MPAIGDDALEQTRQTCKVMSTENDIEMRELSRQLFPITLPDAPANRDDTLRQRRTRTQRNVFHGSNLTVKPGIGRLTNAAGHVNEDIGLLNRIDHEGA